MSFEKHFVFFFKTIFRQGNLRITEGNFDRWPVSFKKETWCSPNWCKIDMWHILTNDAYVCSIWIVQVFLIFHLQYQMWIVQSPSFFINFHVCWSNVVLKYLCLKVHEFRKLVVELNMTLFKPLYLIGVCYDSNINPSIWNSIGDTWY